jgi:ankyrin repeat protein
MRQDRLDRALIAAIERNDVPEVQDLLARGANANARDTDRAPMSLWEAFFTVLHRPGTGSHRFTPALCIAIENTCDISIIRALLDHGGDPNAADSDGQTALWLAAYNETSERWYPDATVLLIDHHADVNIPSAGDHDQGRTLLMNSAALGRQCDVDQLMRAGARIDARNQNGVTALMYAVYLCRTENVSSLLKWHANTNVKANDGDTALASAEKALAQRASTSFNIGAEERNWREIVRFLKQAGARK